MSVNDLREEHMVAGVPNVARGNANQAKNREKWKKDLKGICQGFGNIPLPVYMDTIVSFMKVN